MRRAMTTNGRAGEKRPYNRTPTDFHERKLHKEVAMMKKARKETARVTREREELRACKKMLDHMRKLVDGEREESQILAKVREIVEEAEKSVDDAKREEEAAKEKLNTPTGKEEALVEYRKRKRGGE